jgi:hypothetical protein
MAGYRFAGDSAYHPPAIRMAINALAALPLRKLKTLVLESSDQAAH